MKICAVVPAAGRGTRLNVDCPKILVPVSEKETIWTVLRGLLIEQIDHIHLVLSPTVEPVFKEILTTDTEHDRITTSIQPEPLGMGDAIFSARTAWSKFDAILIVWGDQVNLSKRTIEQVVAACSASKSLVLPLTKLKSPYVQYDLEGPRLVRVRQQREGDATDSIGASDVGLFALSVDGLAELWSQYLEGSSPGTRTGEINFLPFLAFVSRHGWNVKTIEVHDSAEARGVNTPEDLEFARARLKALERYASNARHCNPLP